MDRTVWVGLISDPTTQRGHSPQEARLVTAGETVLLITVTRPGFDEVVWGSTLCLNLPDAMKAASDLCKEFDANAFNWHGFDDADHDIANALLRTSTTGQRGRVMLFDGAEMTISRSVTIALPKA